ncbi:MAG: RHS repeat-associated core domain-containing protein [Dehalococcoidia bacterium]|nr:RHS repeat-associated core domain-containing protein [Dehalococcoidia bacterium]
MNLPVSRTNRRSCSHWSTRLDHVLSCLEPSDPATTTQLKSAESVTGWNMAIVDCVYDDAGRMTTATLLSSTCLGSTMAVVDASGVVQDSYTYDVYGTPSKTGSLANEFDFAGQQTDGTGLQYLRARYYDPATGTFLSREPLATRPSCTLNPSTYGADSPARLADPSGRVPIEGSGQGGGRSDCEGLWSKIVNTVSAIYDAAKTWFDNDYGTWDTGYGSKPGDRMTPESRAAHYQEFDRLQGALDRQWDDYYATGNSKQKNPCPPPGGGLWKRIQATVTILNAEYFRGKSLDDAARRWQGSTSNPSGGWNWHWPKPPDLGNSPE